MLIVVRGNSGSGKSTVAAQLQERLPGKTVFLSQDYFRRVIYNEHEQESLAHADLIEVAATHALRAGHNVVLDGIFNATRYSPMLERVRSATEESRFYAFDLSLEETLRRHRSRSKAGDFTAEEISGWYHGWQPLQFVSEHRIDASESVTATVQRILEDR
ncbi:MAG: kinase [Kineosporiaceae bacterium]|nr:kinase [Aeromicrobium sp.]